MSHVAFSEVVELVISDSSLNLTLRTHRPQHLWHMSPPTPGQTLRLAFSTCGLYSQAEVGCNIVQLGLAAEQWLTAFYIRANLYCVKSVLDPQYDYRCLNYTAGHKNFFKTLGVQSRLSTRYGSLEKVSNFMTHGIICEPLSSSVSVCACLLYGPVT